MKSKNDQYRHAILNEKVPEYLSVNRNKKHVMGSGARSRVLVKSIADLEEYCHFVEALSIKYINFYGHKKAIGELLGVSTNRIGEWQRIYSAATVEYRFHPEIQQVFRNKDNTLVTLLQTLRQAGWQNHKKTESKNDPDNPTSPPAARFSMGQIASKKRTARFAFTSNGNEHSSIGLEDKAGPAYHIPSFDILYRSLQLSAAENSTTFSLSKRSKVGSTSTSKATGLYPLPSPSNAFTVPHDIDEHHQIVTKPLQTSLTAYTTHSFTSQLQDLSPFEFELE